MPRSGEQARQRLQRAALELYREQGYDDTTAAQIAQRAGVTERTFFRHFPDKREVLFGGADALVADLRRGIAEASGELTPLEVLHHAFLTSVPLLTDNRPFSAPRQAVIAVTPALRERELSKEAWLIQVLAEALQRRGIDASRAALAGRIGMAAFSQATGSWLEQPASDLAISLPELLSRSFDELRNLTGG